MSKYFMLSFFSFFFQKKKRKKETVPGVWLSLFWRLFDVESLGSDSKDSLKHSSSFKPFQLLRDFWRVWFGVNEYPTFENSRNLDIIWKAAYLFWKLTSPSVNLSGWSSSKSNCWRKYPRKKKFFFSKKKSHNNETNFEEKKKKYQNTEYKVHLLEHFLMHLQRHYIFLHYSLIEYTLHILHEYLYSKSENDFD